MHFAYVHTLCHKEGHTKLGIFKFNGYWFNNVMNNIFNWWIGLFYGLMPGTYAFGHSINHHSFNNLEGDLISTGWAVRDSMFNWFTYLGQWALYHLNLTSILSFYSGPVRMKKYTKNMCVGVVYYWLFYFGCLYLSNFNFKFIFMYLTYPMIEGGIFLAAVNWSWHLFCDPDEFDKNILHH